MKKKAALFLLILLLFLSGLKILSPFKKREVKPTPKVEFAKIGKEIIYQGDLDFWLKARKEEWKNLNEKEKKEAALKILQEQSIILQEAEKEGLIGLGDRTIFNSPFKYYDKRNLLVDDLKKELEKILITNVSGELVSVWFNNVSAGGPKIPLSEAKNIAYQKITALRNQVKEGKISLEEAGELIKKDPFLENLDSAYKLNAYERFGNATKNNPPFSREELNQLVWSLKEGEVSKVVLVSYLVPEKPGEPNSPVVEKEAHYSFLKINQKTMGEFADFNSWLEAKRKEYPIETD